MEQGADVRSQDYGALRWASRNRHLEVVNYLVEINYLMSENIEKNQSKFKHQ